MAARNLPAAVRRGLTFWRRSIQARIVVSTVVLTAIVVSVVGWFLLQQTRDGLVDNRVKVVRSDAARETAEAKDRLAAVVGTDDDTSRQLEQLIGPPESPVEIDVQAHQVRRDGRAIALTPLEFDLLVALARKPRQVFTREVLLEQVWGYRHAADTRLVNVHVQRLRAKVERDPEHPEVVLTVRGVGYKAGPP